MSILKMEETSNNDVFEIKNGIVGTNRDIIFELIKLMYFRSDDLIQNLIGTCGDCVNWLNHPHFPYYRTIPKLNLKKQIIRNPSLEEKDADINTTSLVFKLCRSRHSRSLFLNVLIKKMIFQCTIRIEFYQNNSSPYICIGISTPSQLKQTMRGLIGWTGNGSGFCFYTIYSRIFCNGSRSQSLKEGGIKNNEVMTAVVCQMNKSQSDYGKMNLIRFVKKVPHTITNIPLTEGVHLGFSSFDNSVTFHIISLHKLSVPPFSIYNGDDNKMRCVGHDFNGNFKDESYNHRDEEGEEIPNIRQYYINC